MRCHGNSVILAHDNDGTTQQSRSTVKVIYLLRIYLLYLFIVISTPYRFSCQLMQPAPLTGEGKISITVYSPTM